MSRDCALAYSGRQFMMKPSPRLAGPTLTGMLSRVLYTLHEGQRMLWKKQVILAMGLSTVDREAGAAQCKAYAYTP